MTDTTCPTNAFETRVTGTCTCHSIRVGAGGVSYSLAIIGVNCGYCEAVAEEGQFHDWYRNLPEAERIAYDIAGRWADATRRVRGVRRPGAPVGADAPPF